MKSTVFLKIVLASLSLPHLIAAQQDPDLPGFTEPPLYVLATAHGLASLLQHTVTTAATDGVVVQAAGVEEHVYPTHSTCAGKGPGCEFAAESFNPAAASYLASVLSDSGNMDAVKVASLNAVSFDAITTFQRDIIVHGAADATNAAGVLASILPGAGCGDHCYTQGDAGWQGKASSVLNAALALQTDPKNTMQNLASETPKATQTSMAGAQSVRGDLGLGLVAGMLAALGGVVAAL